MNDETQVNVELSIYIVGYKHAIMVKQIKILLAFFQITIMVVKDDKNF